MKVLLFSFFLLLSLCALSQDDYPSDSLEMEPIDTNYNHPVGILFGGGFTLGNITGSNISTADTFSNWGSKPQPLYSVGIYYHKDLKEHWSFQSGAIFNLSKIVVNYTLNGTDSQDTSNYSTLAIPILFSYKFTNNPNGMMLSTGVLSEIDISKQMDKNNRVFPLRTISPAAYGAIGYQINTYTSLIEIKLFCQINPLNLFVNNNSTYTTAVEKFYFWRTGIILVLR